jgi:hypothetical protein
MISAAQTFPMKSPPRSASVICAAVAIIPIGDFFILKGIIPHMLWLNLLLNGGILALIIWLMMSLRKTRFEVSEKGLRIRGDMWGRTLSWSELDVAKARIVSFDSEPGLRPKWKTCGTALPGYGSGWFRLHDKSKALIFLSDKTEAVLIPTRKDFLVLLSPADNTKFLQALQQSGKVY